MEEDEKDDSEQEDPEIEMLMNRKVKHLPKQYAQAVIE